MTEQYAGRQIKACVTRTAAGRWAVAVEVDGRRYYTDDGIAYILEEEAEKESLNLGRNLIKRGIA